MSFLLFGLLLALTADISEGDTVSVTTGSNTKVIISRPSDGPNCNVCVDEGSSQACNTKLVINEPKTTQVNFTCSRPQDIFTIEINRELDCSNQCNYDSIQADWLFFQDFNRTFTWDMRVSASTKALQLEFPAPGLRQIQSLEQCPDKHTYLLLMYVRAGPVNLGTFCQNGTVTRILILRKGRLALEVPRDTTLSSLSFKYTQPIGSVLAVDAILPRGQSDTDFFSASGIPADFTMMWNFVLPPKHNFTINFLKNNKPACLSKPVKVTYQQPNTAPVEKTLTDGQPANYQGNFSMLLTNCDVMSAGDPLLSFRVSAFRSGIPDLCTVDLQNDNRLSLQIEKKSLDSFCEMAMDAEVLEKIVVPAGSTANLSFIDCPKDDLILTATKTIECQSLSLCPVAGTLLTIPVLDSCLTPSLHQVVWVLNVPEQGTVELSSPQGSLYQSVPGVQECDGVLSALVSVAGGTDVGRFCSTDKGVIQRVQISSNVSVTATADGDSDLRQQKAPILNVSFSSEITESIVYTVSPLISTPALLGTPNWPGAMAPDSTVSWLVQVPEEYSAQLRFSNVSLPQACHAGHAEVRIKELGSGVELGFREDEVLVPEDVLRSFYLNMSNCEPRKGTFAILSNISLQKNSSKLLNIILGVVGALLAVSIIILAVVCVVLRKKKRHPNSRSSIYIPKGIASLPGDASFPKTRADNDSHVYASIDDTMVYHHLLQQDGSGPAHFNGHQVDSYRTFTGPMDKTVKDTGYEPNVGRGPTFLAPSETFISSRSQLDSIDYEDRRMVDNELYTFKTPGDPNPVRISAAEPALFPEPEADSYSEPEQPEYEEAM